MIKLGIAYLVLCEAIYLLMNAMLSYDHLRYMFERWPRPFYSHGGVTQLVKGCIYGLIAIVTCWAITKLFRRSALTWWLSFSVGVIVLADCWYSIWFGITYANPQTDEGDAALYGFAMLLVAVPAFIVLMLPATRRYLLLSRG